MSPTPALSNKELEETVVEVYQTLRRNKKATVELKRRAKEVLQGAMSNEVELNNDLSGRHTKVCCAASEHFVQTFAGKPKSPEGYVDSKEISNGGKRRSPKQKKSPPNHQTLRTIIFRTLDRIFQLPSRSTEKSQSTSRNNARVDNESRKYEIGIDTLKRLSAFEEDGTPNLQEETISSDRASEISRIVLAEKQPLVILDDESATSSSDENGDEDSWIYVGQVLDINEVTMSDSLSSTIPIPPDFEEKGNIEKPAQEGKFRYKKNLSKKEKSDKIKRRMKEKTPLLASPKPTFTPIVVSEKHKIRPDSPVLRERVTIRKAQLFKTPSLPNLSEQLNESSELSFLECGTDSFKRGAILRPSSTLKKDFEETETEGVEDMGNCMIPDEDDLCSSSSSFSSLQLFPKSDFTKFKGTDRSRERVSALCKNVPIQPIYVPVVPIKESLVKVLPTEEFNRLFSLYDVTPTDNTTKIPLNDFNAAPKDDDLSQSDKIDIYEEDLGIKTVLEEFDWLHDIEDESTNDPKIAGPESRNVTGSESEFLSKDTPSEDESASVQLSPNFTTSNNNSSAVSHPPPPPPPPPPPLPPSMHGAETTINTGTMRSLLSLTVFTKPQEGNNVFTCMTSSELKDMEAKLLKENFPLKKLNDKNEIFLKRWNISSHDAFLDSISTLNFNLERNFDKECFLPFAQFMLKVDKSELSWLLENAKGRDLDSTEEFVHGLTKLLRLNDKLMCIQFSLEFPESYANLAKKAHSFIETSNAVCNSEKFVKIIEMVMTFLNCLNADSGVRIYGFDIQSLNKLARKTSAQDESITLLHYLVEYILKDGSRKDAVDFYLDFKDLPDVAKVSLQELKGQLKAWRKNLGQYKTELNLMREEHPEQVLDFARSFYETAETSLKELESQIEIAKSTFTSCTEKYGLTTSEIEERDFFESISKFTTSFRKVHDGLKEKEESKRRRLSAGNAPPVIRRQVDPVVQPCPRRRQSCGPTLFFQEVTPDPVNAAVDELDQCLQKLLSVEEGQMKRKRARKKLN